MQKVTLRMEARMESDSRTKPHKGWNQRNLNARERMLLALLVCMSLLVLVLLVSKWTFADGA